MESLRSATEDEMVLCFLRAERNSPRWREALAGRIGGRWYLLDQPDLQDEAQNEDRRTVLGYRGYGLNDYLFRGFPDDVEWWFVRMTRAEVGDLMFGQGICDELTEGTRLVSVAAKNASTVECKGDAPGLNEGIARVLELDSDGASLEPLVIVSTSPADQHVLVEGYSRACAYASRPEGPDVEAFAGYSTGIAHWAFWGPGFD